MPLCACLLLAIPFPQIPSCCSRCTCIRRWVGSRLGCVYPTGHVSGLANALQIEGAQYLFSAGVLPQSPMHSKALSTLRRTSGGKAASKRPAGGGGEPREGTGASADAAAVAVMAAGKLPASPSQQALVPADAGARAGSEPELGGSSGGGGDSEPEAAAGGVVPLQVRR